MQEEKKVLMELSDEELEKVVGAGKCCGGVVVANTITAIFQALVNLGGGGGGGAGGNSD
jgi:hypothetical protein